MTVATNMAGRGTDIALGPGVAERGGLHVIMTERHEAGRIDRQLAAAAPARACDPGCVIVMLSMEDSLLQDAGVPRRVALASPCCGLAGPPLPPADWSRASVLPKRVTHASAAISCAATRTWISRSPSPERRSDPAGVAIRRPGRPPPEWRRPRSWPAPPRAITCGARRTTWRPAATSRRSREPASGSDRCATDASGSGSRSRTRARPHRSGCRGRGRRGR